MDTLSSSFLGHSLFSKPHKSPYSIPPRLSISATHSHEKRSQTKKQKTQTSNDSTCNSSQQHNNNNRASSYTSTNSISAHHIPSIAATLSNAIDALINNFIDPPLRRPSVDPRHVLSSNFSPVQELPPTPCPITRGRIPRALAGGAYLRNGPNPQHLPRGPYNLIDGDGMLNSLLLPTSAHSPAILCSRFVQTYKYKTELAGGGPLLPNFFAFQCFNGIGGIARGAVTAFRVLTGQINPTGGVGLANTSLVYFANKLYALGESGVNT